MSKTLAIYEKLAKFPFGNFLFSQAVSFQAPYFRTIHPLITDFRSGYCRIEIKDRRSIQNHFRTIHAGALCTLSELVGGLTVEATIPNNLRWRYYKFEDLDPVEIELTETRLEIRDQNGEAMDWMEMDEIVGTDVGQGGFLLESGEYWMNLPQWLSTSHTREISNAIYAKLELEPVTKYVFERGPGYHDKVVGYRRKKLLLTFFVVSSFCTRKARKKTDVFLNFTEKNP